MIYTELSSYSHIQGCELGAKAFVRLFVWIVCSARIHTCLSLLPDCIGVPQNKSCGLLRLSTVEEDSEAFTRYSGVFNGLANSSVRRWIAMETVTS